MTNAAMLAKVDAALDAFLTTPTLQEWSVLGRTFKRAELSQLWDMRKELVAAVAADDRGGIRVRLARPV